jgi:polar amino acid transport system substrate-binding protein
MVKTGKAVACFNTTITEENKNEFIFHKTPIFEEGLAIFGPVEGSKTGLTTAGLEGSTVGITTGYTYPTDFMQNKSIKKFEANSDEHLLKMLMAKRVQYVILNTMPGMLRIKNDASTAGKVKQVGLISKDGFWLNFSKVHPDGKRMAELFETALLEFKASGRYEKMQTEFKQRVGGAR